MSQFDQLKGNNGYKIISIVNKICMIIKLAEIKHLLNAAFIDTLLLDWNISN